MTFTGDLRESFISGLPQFQIPFSPPSMSPCERDEENPRRGKGKRRGGGKGAPPGRERDRRILGEGHNARGRDEREKKRSRGRRGGDKERKTGGTDKGGNVAKVICTELSFFSAFCSNSLSNGSAG